MAVVGGCIVRLSSAAGRANPTNPKTVEIPSKLEMATVISPKNQGCAVVRTGKIVAWQGVEKVARPA
jgi:hypothetical protein